MKITLAFCMDQLLGSVVPFLPLNKGTAYQEPRISMQLQQIISPFLTYLFFVSVVLILIPFLFKVNLSKERVKMGGNREVINEL